MFYLTKCSSSLNGGGFLTIIPCVFEGFVFFLDGSILSNFDAEEICPPFNKLPYAFESIILNSSFYFHIVYP